MWTLRYSVSVERLGFSASIGFGVAEPLGEGEGDPEPPGEAEGDPEGVGEPLGEGDWDRAASGRRRSIEARERTTTIPIALDRFLKRALLHAVARESATKMRRPPHRPQRD
jgi:hypothetical protein